MRVHLIGVIKDEADIVGQTIVRAAEVADHVYVRDIGSTDGTLEILQEAATKYPNVIVYSEHAPVYTDDLRRDVFLKFRENSKPGDLWGRYDSDEFILEDPRAVFAKAAPMDDVLWGSFFNFYMTEKDVAQFDEDPSRYDDHTPIEGRMRYYLNNWSEPRFVRDHRGLNWKEGRDWPSLLNHCVTQRIRIAHYSYRSPKQIDARLVSRWKMSATGDTVSPIDILPDFRDHILDTTNVLGTADEITAIAKRMVVEANGVPNITWRDRIIPSSDLEHHTPGEAMIDRPDLLPDIPDSSAFVRAGRILARRFQAAKGAKT
jgi:glycosyltransferase involved in cell wall biosynthesis